MRIDLFAMQLSNQNLLETITRTSKKEREIQYEFLCYLHEVDRRKLYLAEGYSSLFAFLTERLGYSESSALKRTQIIRRASTLPQLFWAIQEGKLSLSAAGKLCPYLRRDNFEQLIEDCEGKSVKKIEEVLVKHFPKPDVQDEVKEFASPLSIDRVQISFSADKEFGEKMKRAQALLSHKHPEMKLVSVFTEALDLLLEKLEPKEKGPEAPQENHSRYIRQRIRRIVSDRDGHQCSFVSPSGHRCTETKFLEYDHVKPWALGGKSDDPDNIRLLCSAHNRDLAQKTFGSPWKMAPEMAAQCGS